MQKPPNPHTPESWGAASQGYAKIASRMTSTYADEFVDRLQVDADMRALEVAAGSGALTAALAKRAKSVLATDFAPKMLDLLERRMRTLGVDNVTTKVMDGQALALEDNSFDRAACCFGLMLFPDRAKGFAELHRVLKPGGRAMVSGWAGPEKFDAFRIFLEAIKGAFPDFPAPPGPPPVFSLADPAAFTAQMQAAGFEQVEIDFCERVLELDGFDDLWSMLTAGAPPVQVLFDRVGPGGKDRVRETMAEIVSTRYGSGPIRLKNTATVGCGVKPAAA